MNSITRCLETYWSSSIGKKLVVAITGLVLVLFLAGHLAGNLLIFAGAEAFDAYAEFLHSALHGAGVWIARVVLLFTLVLHVVATIMLTKQNRAARKQYEHKATIQATVQSRTMILSGLTILAFVVFHILHYTVRVNSELAALALESPYKMVVVGFENVWVSLFYVIAMTLLCLHLTHGVASIFQTLGLRSRKAQDSIQMLSALYSLVIWAGFISIPLAIVFGFVKP